MQVFDAWVGHETLPLPDLPIIPRIYLNLSELMYNHKTVSANYDYTDICDMTLPETSKKLEACYASGRRMNVKSTGYDKLLINSPLQLLVNILKLHFT